MKFYYVLDGKKPVEQPDFLKWGEWFEKADRTVAKTMVGNMEISTVFLSLNHNHTREGPPILFETLVFGGDLDGEMWRYETWEEAEEGHRAVVKLVMAAKA